MVLFISIELTNLNNGFWLWCPSGSASVYLISMDLFVLKLLIIDNGEAYPRIKAA